MPELPEVTGLVEFLRDRTVGSVLASAEITSFAALKTFDPPVDSLAGLTFTDVRRHGKFIDFDIDGLHLVIHLALGGWIRWSDKFGDRRLKLGASDISGRFRTDRGDGPHQGFDVIEMGTHKGLAMYVVRDPQDVPGIAALGPDPLAEGFELAPLLNRKMQIKRLLRDQKIMAGIGNAYSDEILHAAKLSPFAIAANLDETQVSALASAITSVLTEAVEGARGKAADELKDDKRARMRVHRRAGEACPVCGDTILEVSYSSSAMQYCPTCQTGGKPLADRRTSKFLK